MNGRKAQSLVVTVLVAIGALLITSLGFAPASASCVGCAEPIVSVAYGNDTAPVSAPAGWTRQVLPDGAVVDLIDDNCTNMTIKAYGFGAGSQYTITAMGWNPLGGDLIPFSGSMTLVLTYGLSYAMGPSFGYAFMTPDGNLFSANEAPGCPPALQAGVQPTPTPKPTQGVVPQTLAQMKAFCAAHGKVAKRLKGKARRLARKRHKPLWKCVVPKKKHKKASGFKSGRVLPSPARLH